MKKLLTWILRLRSDYREKRKLRALAQNYVDAVAGLLNATNVPGNDEYDTATKIFTAEVVLDSAYKDVVRSRK